MAGFNPHSVFAHVTAENAAQYRAIMEAFAAAKERFSIYMRPIELSAALATAGFPAEDAMLRQSLLQLVSWGNLDEHPDTDDVATVEDFYRRRSLYQLSSAGEAAERALSHFAAVLTQKGELQTAALEEIRGLLKDLVHLTAQDPVDAAKNHRLLRELFSRFEELTSRAQGFMGSLQRAMQLHGIDVREFLDYKQTLIDYLERFIGQLLISGSDICALLQRLHATAADLLEMAAASEMIDALVPTQDDLQAAHERWRTRWEGLHRWFVRDAGSGEPQSEVLRGRARAAIPALLAKAAALNEQRQTRSDRVADLRTLARWFAEADTDAEALRLWRAAFGLTSSRHLRIDAATLEAREAYPVPAHCSWLAAPPVVITPRLRATGSYSPRGKPRGVIDRSDGKRLLAEVAKEQSVQAARAAAVLMHEQPMRLSSLGELDGHTFALFLELLGEALRGKLHPEQEVQALSLDGALHITLRPAGDDHEAVIATPHGQFRGPDHFIFIVPSAAKSSAA